MTAPSDQFNFDELSSLKQFVDRYRGKQGLSLLPFNDDLSGGFKLREDTPDKYEISMSSTATCIGAFVQAGTWGASIPPEDRSGWWAGTEADLFKKLLRSKWTSAGLERNNAFTIGFVVEACQYLRQVSDLKAVENEWLTLSRKEYRENAKRELGLPRKTTYGQMLAAGIEQLQLKLFNPKARTDVDRFPVGSVSVLEYPPSAYLTQLSGRALMAVGKLSERNQDQIASWAAREIVTQISLIESGSRSADPLQLAYAITCVASFRPPSKETPSELELIQYGLKIFFSQQLSDGSWPQSRPLFHYPSAGSAYCFEYETLAQMFLCRRLHEPLFAHIKEITKATLGLDNKRFKLNNGGFAWASDQTPQNAGPESWSTASVFLYLFALDRFLAEAIRRSISLELEVPYVGIQASSPKRFAESFLDCPIYATKNSNGRGSLKKQMLSLLVRPVFEHRNLVGQGQKLPKQVPVSAILFGPPGTSKTEIIEQIASFIGWPAMTVDPSYFVRLGMDAIQAQANRIFRMLSSAEQIVVLFDEFDEMVKNRADAGDVLSRFLTTAMLPKLATINKERKILFIVATNYIDSFDIAISRPGRFDFIFQMMPPKPSEKMKHKAWSETLGWLQKQKMADFEVRLADLTFLECDKLVRQIFTLKRGKTKFSDLKGPELARAKKRAQAIWLDATDYCILRTENERYTPRRVHNGGAAAEVVTWKGAAMEEVRYIRPLPLGVRKAKKKGP